MNIFIIVTIISLVVFLIYNLNKKRRNILPSPIPIPEPVKKESIYHIVLDVNPEVDNTVSIQEQIDAIPDGTSENVSIVQFPEGDYWTEGKDISRLNKGIIKFHDRHYLEIRGGSFYTKRPGIDHVGNVGKNDLSLRRHIYVTHSSNLKFIDTRIEGSNKVIGDKVSLYPDFTPDWWIYGRDAGAFGPAPAYLSYIEQEHAFAVESSNNITFENVSVDGVFGDGIYLGGDYLNPSTNILIKGGHLKRLGRQGIAGKNIKDVIVDGVIIELGRRAGIDWENDREFDSIINVTVKNCTIETMQTVFAMVGRGYMENIIFEDNKYQTGGATLTSYDSLLKTRRKGLIFRNNIRIHPWSFGSPIASITMMMWDDVLIENNIELISGSQSKTSCYFKDCNQIKVLNNNFDRGDNIVNVNSDITSEGNIPQQIIK